MHPKRSGREILQSSSDRHFEFLEHLRGLGTNWLVGVETGLERRSICAFRTAIFNNYPAKSCGISPDTWPTRPYCLIIQQIDNKTNNFIRPGKKKLFYLQFSLLRRTKLRISQDICYQELQILRES